MDHPKNTRSKTSDNPKRYIGSKPNTYYNTSVPKQVINDKLIRINEYNSIDTLDQTQSTLLQIQEKYRPTTQHANNTNRTQNTSRNRLEQNTNRFKESLFTATNRSVEKDDRLGHNKNS